MGRFARFITCLGVSSCLALVGTVRGEIVNVTSHPYMDYAQLGVPGYLTTRDLTINSTSPGEFGPVIDMTFTKRFGKLSIEYPSPQNWTGTDMILFDIENMENRQVNIAFASGILLDINNFTGGFACTAQLPPLSTKRYALVFTREDPQTYQMKRMPAPFNGEFVQVANFTGWTSIQWSQMLHWRFSYQDTLPARIVLSNFRRAEISYDFNNVVDEFFQLNHGTWPGKVETPADILTNQAAEEADLLANPITGSPNGSQSLPVQQATGDWYTKVYNGKHYIVTPSGRLFWSFGLNGIHDWTSTEFTGRENMFETLPSPTGPNADLFENITNFQGQSVLVYRTQRHNLRYKYGANHFTQWRDLTNRRLSSWGINTVGGWSEYRIADGTKPYVIVLTTTDYPNRIVTPSLAWGPPPDPYATDFEQWIQTKFSGQLQSHIERPNFMGCYVDNELSWGHTKGTLIDRFSVAIGTLSSPRNQPAKVEFIRALVRKYRTIRRLNTAWRTNFGSFDAMNNVYTISNPAQITGAMQTDFRTFIQKFAAAYFSKVRGALTTAGMTDLYFGSRFFHQTPEVIKAASAYVDILTFNDYSLADQYAWPFYAGLAKPIMISEWSCPVNDDGTFGFHNLTYQQRREQVTQLLTAAAQQPNIVGVHWFEMYDHPVTNRGYDFENIGFGVVDVTDNPHQETVDAFRDFASAIYSIRNP